MRDSYSRCFACLSVPSVSGAKMLTFNHGIRYELEVDNNSILLNFRPIFLGSC